LQFTWGIIQNIIGFFFFLKYRKQKHEFYHGSVITYHDEKWGGISMGIFIIMNGKRDEEWIRGTRVHEFGHTIQSIILGPLYMFVIGIPSFIWCNAKKFVTLRKEKGVSYFSFYPEKWANHLGVLITKEAAPVK
jgi:hypothetical protein